MTRTAVLALALAALPGCTPPPPEGTVSGEVTLDGKPVPRGMIRFEPADGPGADGEIQDGRYAVKVRAGEAVVRVSAPRVTGKRKMYDTPDSPTVDEMTEQVAAKFGVQSEVKYEVKPGPQEKSFEVKSR